MNGFSLQLAVRVLIILAGVYQLGACPCGCLAHNGWTEAAASLVTDAPAPVEEPCDHREVRRDHTATDARRVELPTAARARWLANAVASNIFWGLDSQLGQAITIAANDLPNNGPPPLLRVLRL